MIALVLVVGCGFIARWAPRLLPAGEALWAPARSRWAPLAIGVLSALVALLSAPGGTLRVAPRIADEWGYLVQAQLFAAGRWTGPPRPAPDAFVEPLIVAPVLASKYPPGESLALVPGLWLGLPALMPILLTGLTGGLLFSVVRTIAGEIVATLTVLYWLSLDQTIMFHASYMSEVTSGAAWLVACWALLRWVRLGTSASLIVVGFAVGVIAITRPLTAVGMTLPIMGVVLWLSYRRRAWGPLGPAVLAGLLVVAVLPLANAETTGSWRVLADDLYRRTYIPFDKPGFGLDSTPPLRAYPPDLDHSMDAYREGHRGYVPAAVPAALVARLRQIGRDVWPGSWHSLAPFVTVALFWLPLEGWFALATLGSVVICYLSYWHPPFWSVYYLEVEPVLCFVTAFGVMRAVQWIAGQSGQRRVSVVVVPLALACCVAIEARGRDVRLYLESDVSYYQRFDRLLISLRSPAIVFVHYGPGHNVYRSLVRNPADLSTTPVWVAYDSPDAEARLRRLAPDRAQYRFDEATWTLSPVPAVAARSAGATPAGL